VVSTQSTTRYQEKVFFFFFFLDRTSGARQQGAPSIWTESIQTGGMGVHRRRIGRGRDRRSDKKARGNGLYTTRNHCLTKKTTFKWLRVTWDETHIKVRGQQSKGGGLRIDRTVRKGRQALGHGLEGSQGVGPARWTEGLRTRELHSCGNTKERGGGPRLIH
jgi:hypothetical protein